MSDNLYPVPPVSGYRQLSQAEVDLMNEVKAAFNAVGVVLDKLANAGKGDAKVSESVAIDHRCVAIARTEAQTAAMWAIRSITKPGGFA